MSNIVFFCFVPFFNKVWGNNFKMLVRTYRWGYTVCYEALHMGEWVSGYLIGIPPNSDKPSLNLLKILKTCDEDQFRKVLCFQPAILLQKWNPLQVFFKEFVKIKTRKQKILNTYFIKRIDLCFTSQTIIVVSKCFFSVKQLGKLCNKLTY